MQLSFKPLKYNLCQSIVVLEFLIPWRPNGLPFKFSWLYFFYISHFPIRAASLTYHILYNPVTITTKGEEYPLFNLSISSSP
jgi:hypothetical protein